MICEYCGRIYYGQSYCCPITGLFGVSSEYILDGRYTCDYTKTDGKFNCFKSIPFLFNLVFIGTIYFGFFMKRTLKHGEKYYSTYETDDRSNGKILVYFFFFLFTLAMSIIYFFPFFIIYIGYLIIFFKDYEKSYN